MYRVFVVRVACVALALIAASLISLPPITSFIGSAVANFGMAANATVSNRALKGDKLPVAETRRRPHELEMPASPLPSQAHDQKVPVGCDSAFSSISSPPRANIFRRCMV